MKKAPIVPRNKEQTSKYIVYNLPGSVHEYTCRPAPSSKLHSETEDEWLERSKARYLPTEAQNVRILSD